MFNMGSNGSEDAKESLKAEAVAAKERIANSGRELRSDLQKTAGDARRVGSEVKAAASDFTHDVAETVGKLGGEISEYAQEKGGQFIDDALDCVRKHPGTSLIGLVAAGFFLGFTMRR